MCALIPAVIDYSPVGRRPPLSSLRIVEKSPGNSPNVERCSFFKFWNPTDSAWARRPDFILFWRIHQIVLLQATPKVMWPELWSWANSVLVACKLFQPSSISQIFPSKFFPPNCPAVLHCRLLPLADALRHKLLFALVLDSKPSDWLKTGSFKLELICSICNFETNVFLKDFLL